MALTDTPKVTLDQIACTVGDIPRARVLLDGVDTGCVVDGAICEASFATPRGLLLFVTDDIPFEESLTFHLLSREQRLIDSARLSALNNTGVLRDLEQIGPGRFRFRFLGNTLWQLTVLDKPRLMIPILNEGRSIALKRMSGYLVLKRVDG